jgi:hypothetical protein
LLYYFLSYKTIKERYYIAIRRVLYFFIIYKGSV